MPPHIGSRVPKSCHSPCQALYSLKYNNPAPLTPILLSRVLSNPALSRNKVTRFLGAHRVWYLVGSSNADVLQLGDRHLSTPDLWGNKVSGVTFYCDPVFCASNSPTFLLFFLFFSLSSYFLLLFLSRLSQQGRFLCILGPVKMGFKDLLKQRSGLRVDNRKTTAAASLTLRQSLWPLSLVTILFFLWVGPNYPHMRT